MGANFETVVEAILGIKTTTVVSCPTIPAKIEGSSSAGAYTADDCLGLITKLAVPKRGVIISAILFDLDDEGSQIDLEVFKNSILQVASEAAFAPSDGEILTLVTELNFTVFDDHGAGRSSEVNNLGIAYTAPAGFFWIQAVTRSTPTIAAGSEPRFQLRIQSFDSSFRES